jgi:dipeptidyl aminopeptidase/acylaminoacyl peptidase
MFKYIQLFLLLFILSSCSFNKMFLVPYKIAKETKQIEMRTKQGDTIITYFTGDEHQPLITKNRIPLETDYTIESIVFTSKNGNKLNGWLIKPKNVKADVTLLHFHGNAANMLYQVQAIAPLAKKGFQIFMFDYSGFGFSEGKATRKNVRIDANSALDYIKSREEVKNTKLVIYGQSLGGHLSAVVANDRQADIDALVIEGAFSSHHDVGAYMVRRMMLIGGIARVFMKDGYSAKKSIKSYKKPLLVVHSTEDEVIPEYMGKRIFKKATTPTKEFYEINKCHICGPIYYTDEIAGKIRKMLQ